MYVPIRWNVEAQGNGSPRQTGNVKMQVKQKGESTCADPVSQDRRGLNACVTIDQTMIQDRFEREKRDDQINNLGSCVSINQGGERKGNGDTNSVWLFLRRPFRSLRLEPSGLP